MKHLLLFAVVLSTILSCSSDDDKSGNNSTNSELKVTIDGVQKTFNKIYVNEIVEDGNGPSILQVSATINDDPSEIITFDIYKGEIGSDRISYFYYTKNGVLHIPFNGENTYFSSVTQINDNGRIKSSFSGILQANVNGAELSFTNGSLDIYY